MQTNQLYGIALATRTIALLAGCGSPPVAHRTPSGTHGCVGRLSRVRSTHP